MALEMVSFRVMAPFFGTSTIIWSLIIATVMFLIFVGNLLGGKLSQKYSDDKLFLIIGVASIVSILLSQSLIIFLEYIYTTKLIYNMLFFAVLMILSSVIISLPILFISMSSPWLIKIASKDADINSVGAIAGKLYAVNTVGGLLGTFLPVIILVPVIGSKFTILLVSFILLLGSLIALFILKKRRLVFILLIIFLISSLVYIIPSSKDKNTIVKDESIYNTIWIEKYKNRIDFKVNEKKAVQSRLYTNKKVFIEDVWSLYLTAAFFNKNKKNPEVLFLGLGAGSSAYYYNKYFPNYKLTGVEIDGKIVDYGKKYFGLDKYNVDIFVDDARMFLNKTRKKYDIVVVDTFKFPYIPSHLATLEFIELINKKLNKGGVALFNIGRFKKDNDIVKMISQTGLKSFKCAYTYELSNKSNTFVYFMNHNKSKYYTKIPNIHNHLIVLFMKMKNSLKKVNIDNSVEISVDDKPLTEMLTNKIILKNIREIF